MFSNAAWVTGVDIALLRKKLSSRLMAKGGAAMLVGKDESSYRIGLLIYRIIINDAQFQRPCRGTVLSVV